MADKSIDQLNAAEKIYASDLFVLQQSGTAKKLTGRVLLNWLTAAADGHGGIQSIQKLSTSGLDDTYRITLADTTIFDFVVTNGRGISGIEKTSTSGLVDTYTITMNDGTTSELTVTNGEKGDNGDNTYVWIKYASQEPTESSHSIGDIPDNWIGIYSGNASSAPTDWKQYRWFKIKGEQGNTGDAATLKSKSVTYQVGDSGSIIPSGSWGSSVPVVPHGKYLWTKTEIQFNTGEPIVSYSVARMGIDGSGSVSSVNNVSPDETGNVTLTADNVGARPDTWMPTATDVGAVPASDFPSNFRFGDPYDGVDLVAKFADEISGYTDPGAWIRARIRANNFDGVHVNDYIPFTTTNGLSFKARVAGIDPYYEYGDSYVGHHIDFICEELWHTPHPINPVKYNNGLIPTENVTSDGTATQYVIKNPMYGVAKVTLSGTDLTGWTYDKDTYTLTFSTAPAAGTMVVTGTGSEYPWLSCDAYMYANSLAGHVPNGTGLNPAIKRVDYTNDGIYHYLPDWLKAVIIEKRFLLNKRYSTSGVLSDESSWGWTNIGKIWFPTEVEVYGFPIWGSKGGYGIGGSIQYPYFVGNMRRLKKRSGDREYWWLLSPEVGTTHWTIVNYCGNATSYNVSFINGFAPVCFRIG